MVLSNLLRLLFLLLPCIACAGTGLAAPATQPRQVVFIRYPIAPAHFAEVINQFKNGMTLRGYVEGRDIIYTDILTKTADQQSIPEVREAVLRHKDRVDMFITCGWVSMPARDILQTTKVPQLFVPVLESVAREMLPSLAGPPATNLSGIYLMYPPEKILRIARLIMPKSRHYAYVHDSRIPADRVFKNAYDDLSLAGRHGFTLFFPDLADGVNEVVGQLRSKKIDAWGGIVGSFQHQQSLRASDVPQITALTLDIDRESIRHHVGDDIIAGLFNPFGACGAQAAAMTADIFSGKTTIAETRPQPASQVSFINLKAARKRNLSISFDALEAVDILVK